MNEVPRRPSPYQALTKDEMADWLARPENSQQAAPTPAPSTDPMEKVIAGALDAAGVRYVTDHSPDSPCGLDFYLPDADLHIEVKQMHSPRISEQMSRAPNVIAIQGLGAAHWVAELIRSGKFGPFSPSAEAIAKGNELWVYSHVREGLAEGSSNGHLELNKRIQKLDAIASDVTKAIVTSLGFPSQVWPT